jgi:hypothetical protein
MTAESQNSGTNRCSIATKQYGKHVSMATNTEAIIENMVFSIQPLLGNGVVKAFPQQEILGHSVFCAVRAKVR